jgi:PEP-CTERM motif
VKAANRIGAVRGGSETLVGSLPAPCMSRPRTSRQQPRPHFASACYRIITLPLPDDQTVAAAPRKNRSHSEAWRSGALALPLTLGVEMKNGSIGLAAAALLCAGGADANTLIIQPGYFEIFAQGAPRVLTGPGNVSGTGFNPGSEGGSEYSESYLTYGNPGEVTEYVSGTTVGGVAVANANSLSYADIYYYLTGPANVAVPLVLTVQSTGPFAPQASGPEAIAEGTVQWAGGAFYDCAATGADIASCGTEPRSFSGSQTSDAYAGIEYSFIIESQGHSTEGTGGYYVGIDPMIQIAPGFAEAREFSLVFSPAVGAIPEPSTWAMMLIAFAGMGYAGWRQYANRLRAFG